MNLRLFIAIAVPETIKEKIRELIKEIQPAFRGRTDFRWVSELNWHWTIIFLGSEPEDAMPKIEKAMAKTEKFLEKEKPIGIKLTKLVYGPGDRRDGAKSMIWLEADGQTSKKLGAFKNILAENILKEGVRFERDNYGFHAHLTLARFEPKPASALPAIERLLDWQYEAKTLDLMQSYLRRSGAVYEKLFSVALD